MTEKDPNLERNLRNGEIVARAKADAEEYLRASRESGRVNPLENIEDYGFFDLPTVTPLRITAANELKIASDEENALYNLSFMLSCKSAIAERGKNKKTLS